MASNLVLYGTSEEQTAKVAERLASRLTERGHETTVVDAAADPTDHDPAAFDAVLVGTSTHVGAQQPPIVEFARTNRETLAAMPTGLFRISLSSGPTTPSGVPRRRATSKSSSRRPAGSQTVSGCSAARYGTRSTVS